MEGFMYDSNGRRHPNSLARPTKKGELIMITKDDEIKYNASYLPKKPKVNQEQPAKINKPESADAKQYFLTDSEINVLLSCVEMAGLEGYYLQGEGYYNTGDIKDYDYYDTLKSVLTKFGVDDIRAITNGYVD